MYSAIAGLKAHMNKLNVIGNNVANVNTNSYKSQRAVFRDSMYTMYSGGSDGSATMAGKNPSQIGYGSQMASVDLNMVRGNFTPGRPTDCMLEGDGFFLVGSKTDAEMIDPRDPNSFKGLTLTRVGDFGFGPDGYLKDGSGQGNAVYGFMVVGKDPTTGEPLISDQLVPIRLPKVETVPVNIKTGNEIPADQLAGLKEGEDYKMSVVVRYATDGLTDKNHQGPADVLQDYVKYKDPAKPDDGTIELPYAQLDGISFDSTTGAITGKVKETGEQITVAYLAVGNVTNNNGLTLEGNSYFTCGPGAGDLQVGMLGGAAEKLKDGRGQSITHVNGSRVKDPNAQDAVELSDKGLIGSAGKTVLRSGGLEGSNADLATEISELITTQRGYQANTRIITVTDSMLEELVNMKR